MRRVVRGVGSGSRAEDGGVGGKWVLYGVAECGYEEVFGVVVCFGDGCSAAVEDVFY